MIDFDAFDALTFDCYGTLIDWERGILNAMRPLLSAHGLAPSDEDILECYAELESEAERAEYLPYREVLRRVMRGFGKRLGFEPSAVELDALPESLGSWPPFPDTIESLRRLNARYQLAIVSNVDDDLFAASARRLEVEFDWVITAEQVKSYKPSPNNFKQAIATIGLPCEKILHVAQSLYHDIQPARALGLTTVWVNRRRGKPGSGATAPAEAEPHLEVPDLATLVSMIEGEGTPRAS